MDYPYRLGNVKTERGVTITEVLSADGLCLFGTIQKGTKDGPIAAVTATGEVLGHFYTKVLAAKTVSQWGVDNVEGRDNGRC